MTDSKGATPIKKQIPRVDKISYFLLITGAVVLVIAISLEFFGNKAFGSDSPTLRNIQFWVCMVFLLDFFVNLFMSKNTWSYLAHNWILFFISLPVVNIVYHYDLSLTHEQALLLKLIPLLRGGFALAVIVKWMTNNRLTSLFVSYLTMLAGFTYFSSFVFYSVERGVNPLVANYGDAIWWACMDVTTVGSDINAVTTIGRVLSITLAATGMMMFPIFTAYITTKFQTKTTRSIKKDSHEDQAI